jgi:hypothetical protein
MSLSGARGMEFYVNNNNNNNNNVIISLSLSLLLSLSLRPALLVFLFQIN